MTYQTSAEPGGEHSGPVDTVALGEQRSGRVAHYGWATAWLANVVLLVSISAWIYGTGSAPRTILQLASVVGGTEVDSQSIVRDLTRLGVDAWVLGAGALVALATLLAMLSSLFLGASRFRTTRSWLVFTTLLAGWLGLLVAWPEVHWLGQQRRVARALEQIALTAEVLKADWPADDVEYSEIGSFLAYPNGRPTTLLALSPAEFIDSGLQFAAVERSADEALRFELTSDELGVWVEWRHDGVPRAFGSGVGGSYRVVRYARLAPHWYLVRYGR